MTREERIAIYKETMKIVNDGYYIKDGKKISICINEDDKILKDTPIFQDGKDISHIAKSLKCDSGRKLFDETEVKVINEDTLIAAKDLIAEGLNPSVLNMASFVFPGGGVLHGSAAQEENLFRRTDLFKSLYRFHEGAYSYLLPSDQKASKHYPLSLHHGGIMSQAVTVFRDSEANDYRLLDEPYKVNVVTIAALKNPTLTKEGKLAREDYEITKEKIRDILYHSFIVGNDSVVLGAMGCGAYRTPPEEIAKAFKDVLSEDDFKGCFKKIVFAVFDDHNSHRPHNPRGNYLPFKEIIEGYGDSR